ncbi:unnamed protein product [Candidula unifasciata]|uniref:CARD domain-containing protein n=1 Tax=Candidula unifasciata TaxID=100452 RepID=A0A8S3ZH15_9EUPU|nr:unnamed protein product [Candidula unifasciata]
MTSVARNGTYVINNRAAPPVDGLTGINRQNIMRLKINRVALVQELKVEHVSGMLIKNGAIDVEDMNKINSGTSPQEKTRILLDLLPTKGNTAWYRHFREALQNPDADPETRRRYRVLVNFLDNAVIHRPLSQMTRFRDRYGSRKQVQKADERNSVASLPYYLPLPDIQQQCGQNKKEEVLTYFRADNVDIFSKKVTDKEAGHPKIHSTNHRDMTLVQGQFFQWFPTPDNFRSLLEIPEGHKQRLASSDNSDDQVLLDKETMVLNILKRVEVTAALVRHKCLPPGFELCLSDAVQDLLKQPELYHLYLKHILILEAADVMIVEEISSSYNDVLQTVNNSNVPEMVNQVTQTGLKMASLLIAVNKFSKAASVLNSLIQFLRQRPNMEVWVPQFQAYIKLMHAWNLACRPDRAEVAYFEAVQMQYQITMMSFGQSVVHYGAMHAETSHMLLEHGSISSAYGWSRKALREVNPEDSASVLRVLCVTINACCANWLVRKAELLSVYAVQYARSKFGERHPLYIEALLHFCHFSNEFKWDSIGLHVARDVLDAAEKTYGCESLQVAQAHCCVSRALMCMQMVDTDDYYTHAMEAVRISRLNLGQHSPLLHSFLHTFAYALQLKALHCPEEVVDSTLRWAETEAKQALNLVTQQFGEISLKVAQILLLLGQINCKMNKPDVAESYLKQAVDYLKLCQPSFSNYLLLGMANLASFYKIILRPELAIPRFQFVVDHIETTDWYCKWVHECFEELSQLYHSLGQEDSAEAVQYKLSQWLKVNPMNNKPVEYSRLKQEPEAFESFLAKADLWTFIVLKVLDAPMKVSADSQSGEEV